MIRRRTSDDLSLREGYVLILNRKLGEAIVMDGGIRVVVLHCDRRGVRLGIEAPGQTGVFREELVNEGKAQVERTSAPMS